MDAVKVILDEQINIGADRAKLLRVSGTQITYNTPSNNGSIVGGQILFSNLSLPSLSSSVISRNMRIRYRVSVTANAGTLGLFNPNFQNRQGAVVGGTFPDRVDPPKGALRPFALTSCTDTLILTVNNVPIATSNRQMMSGLMRTIPKEYLEKQATEGPSQLDNGCILVSDANLAVVAGVAITEVSLTLTSSQPLSSNFNCPYSTSRGSFAPISYTSDGVNPDVAVFEVCEPVFSPILSLYEDNRFLSNVNTLSIQYSYSNLGDMFVYAYGQAYPAGYAVSLVDNSARIEYSVISLDNRVVAIPRVVSYDYNMPQFFPTPLSAFTAPVSTGAVQNTGFVQSQSLRLSYMPSLIYIYAQVPVATRCQNAIAGSASLADFYYALGNASGSVGAGGVTYNTDQTNIISINLNNRQGLGAGLSIRSLYRLAVSNGYVSSFNDWLASPVVILSPTKDLGLDLGAGSDIYPNQNGNVTLSFQASFNNSNVLQRTMELNASGSAWLVQTGVTLMCLCIQEGIAEISPDTLVLNGGSLSATEVKVAIEEGASAESPETAFVPSVVEKQGAGLKDMFGKTRNVVTSVAKGIGAVIDDPTFRAVLRKAEGGGRLRR